MFLTHFFSALLIALMFSLIFAMGFRGVGPGLLNQQPF